MPLQAAVKGEGTDSVGFVSGQLTAVPNIQILKSDEKWKNLENERAAQLHFHNRPYQDTGEKRFTIVSSCNRSQLLLQRPQEGEFQKPTVKNLRKLCHVRARVKLSLSKWRDGKSSLEPQTALKLLLQKSYHGRDLL